MAILDLKSALSYFANKVKAKFVAKEFKTGSTTEYKVLSDNNLTDALKTKIENAGVSDFTGEYDDLTGKPSIGGKEIVAGDQTAASLGLATADDAANAKSEAISETKTWVGQQGYQNASQVSAAVTSATADMATESWVTGKGYQNADQVAAAVTAGKEGMATEQFVEDKGYQTAAQVNTAVSNATTGMATQTWVEGKGYQNASQVSTAITEATEGMATEDFVTGKGYQTEAQVSSAISTATTGMATQSFVEGKGYQNATQVNEAISNAVSAVYKPKGSSAFASLPAPSKTLLGGVYNVTDAFTTTAAFVEGAGKTYPAGTNVVVVNPSGTTYNWDVLSGAVDLSGYAMKSEFVAVTDAEIDAMFN